LFSRAAFLRETHPYLSNCASWVQQCRPQPVGGGEEEEAEEEEAEDEERRRRRRRRGGGGGFIQS